MSHASRTHDLVRILLVVAIALAAVGSGLIVQPVYAAANLSVEIIAAPNLIVDSNVLSPSTAQPIVATVIGKFCNTSTAGETLTNVVGRIGNGATAGTYPQTANNPTFSGGGVSTTYRGQYSFTHLGTATDASRHIGTLAAGECSSQYWSFTYPKTAINNVNGLTIPAWGTSVKPGDDLALQFFIWGTADGSLNGSKSHTMTMRNEISAMANKIEPNGNPSGQWFNTDTSTINPGETVTTNGILYRLGNINQGFDNNNDGVPDYNAWLQPFGDPAYDPNCFRLVKTSGLLTVTTTSGDVVIPFQDSLYFTDLPQNNTNAIGLVYYTFLALGGACTIPITPYQEVASGSDNEKFNGDYGAGPAPVGSYQPKVTISKSAPGSVNEGATYTYQIPFANTSITATAGLIISSGGVDMPLVISDTVPAGLEYVCGSAAASLSGSNTATILFSTDSGATWNTNQPTGCPGTNPVSTGNIKLMWKLNNPLPKSPDAGSSGNTATFQAHVPSGYITGGGKPFVENCADGRFGISGAPFATACAVTMINGTGQIGNRVWVDSNSNGAQDAGETTQINNVTITLYWDKNGNGLLDSADVPVATQSSGAITDADEPNTNYNFTSLPDGKYLVKIDKADPDIDTAAPGYALTTAEIIPATLSSSGRNVNTVDFGFGPVLTIDKHLSSVDPAVVGEQVTFHIDLKNLLPGDGTPQGFCQYTTWATTAGTHNGTTGWQNRAGAFDSVTGPNGNLAYIVPASQNDPVGGTTFALSLPSGATIRKVEAVYSIYVNGTFVDDTLQALYYYGGTPYPSANPTAIPVATINAFGPDASKQGLYVWDVTGARTWTINDFNGTNLEIVFQAQKAGGSTGDAVLRLDAMGFRVTTDQTCGGADTTIGTLPLVDVYDADKLQFVSANPPATSSATGGSSPFANTGVITWTNIGTLYAGGTQHVELTFKAKATTTSATVNTATSTNAKYQTGRTANTPVSDTATVNINQAGSISGYIWSDQNGSGWSGTTGYNTGDTFIPGVEVELWGCFNAVTGLVMNYNTDDGTGSKTCTNSANNGTWLKIRTTRTNASGYYIFDGLRPGYYNVIVAQSSLPVGYDGINARRAEPDPTSANTGFTCGTCDGQWNSDNGNNTVALQDLREVGGDDAAHDNLNITNVSFGYQDDADSQGAVIGYVWKDTNNNGVWDWIDSNSNGVWDYGEGEPPIPGVTVYLCADAGDNPCNAGNANYPAATTDVNGRYSFGNLVSGANFRTGVDSASGALSGMTQTGDPDVAGNCSGTCDHQTTPVFSVAANQVVSTNGTRPLNFGYNGGISIGDTIYVDWNGNGTQDNAAIEVGIPGVKVHLYLDNPSSGTVGVYDPGIDVYLGETTTAGDGTYSFANLPGGTNDYVVTVGSSNIPAGYVQTGDPEGGCTSGATCDGRDFIPDIGTTNYVLADFGYQPRGAGLIGDTVWLDANGNATQESTESGRPNVTVKLFNDVNGDGTIDANDAQIASTITLGYNVIDGYIDVSGNGAIGAEDALTSLYGIRVIAGGLDVNGDGFIGDGTTYPADNSTFGPYQVINGRLDINRDGTATAAADGNLKGFYLFKNLPAGNFIVQVDAAEFTTGGDLIGYIMTNSTISGDYNGMQISRKVALAASQQFLAADFGFATTKIGDTVWQDNNGDGIQGTNEPGINGVTMQLYRDANNNGVWDAGDEYVASVDTATLDGQAGKYFFSAMAPGNYIVRVDPAEIQAGGTLASYQLTGDPDAYSITNPDSVSCLVAVTSPVVCDGVKAFDRYAAGSPYDDPLAIRAGSVELTADFGYQPLGVIGDAVWIDSNSNGVRDADEQGIERITVQLCTDSTCSTVVRTTETDENGEYSFGGIADGTYSVRVLSGTATDPDWPSNNLSATYNFAGAVDSITNLIVVSGGHVSSVETTSCSGCDLKIDFGYRFSGTNSITGTAWNDGSTPPTPNKIIDASETIRYGEVPIYLWWCVSGCGGTDDILVGSTVSASDGTYSFTGLADGTYRVVANSNAYTLRGTTTTTPVSVDNSGADQPAATLGGGTTTAVRNFGYLSNMDLGDLPSDYNNTLLADNGARHTLLVTGQVYLGTTVTVDPDGKESSNASGDTDEGVVRTSGVKWTAGSATGGSINVTVGGCATTCYLSAWTDWGKDNNFTGTNERILIDQAVTNGTQPITFNVPAGVFPTTSNTFNFRFRLYPSSTRGLAQPTGLTTNGEAEDYQWSFGTTAVTLNSMTARAEAGDLPLLFTFILMGAGAVLIIIWAKRHRIA